MRVKRVQVIVSGYVQGVAFRASCQREARAYGVTGWVRNRWDGSVEALFEGPPGSVDALVQWCHHGPPAATVTGVEVNEAPTGESHRSFSIRS
jgi:acylphosphatase